MTFDRLCKVIAFIWFILPCFSQTCKRKVEAERSMHYLAMPQILVLQLKRFAMSSWCDGLVKINDFAPTPLEIPCFEEGCRKACTHS